METVQDPLAPLNFRAHHGDERLRLRYRQRPLHLLLGGDQEISFRFHRLQMPLLPCRWRLPDLLHAVLVLSRRRIYDNSVCLVESGNS